MVYVNKVIIGVALLVFGAIFAAGCTQQAKTSTQPAKAPGEIVATTKHGKLTLDQIAEIQPGLGTVMIEYGTRYYRLYYAAKAGNWDLAKYQLKEATEIQEVGELTRPGKAPMLKSFESAYLDPLDKAIDAKDWSAFETAYNKGVEGCNGCHAATGHPYIKYVLPSNPPEMPETITSK